MNGMKRAVWLSILAVAAAAVVFTVSWKVATRVCADHYARDLDDLTWLQEEFDLGSDEMTRIRGLYEAYVPKCEAFCREIAKWQARIDELIGRGDLADPQLEEALRKVGELRGQCQAHMLRHFQEVARAMPPEQGRRFLEVVTGLVLRRHEEVERRMAGQPTGASHEHHH